MKLSKKWVETLTANLLLAGAIFGIREFAFWGKHRQHECPYVSTAVVSPQQLYSALFSFMDYTEGNAFERFCQLPEKRKTAVADILETEIATRFRLPYKDITSCVSVEVVPVSTFVAENKGALRESDRRILENFSTLNDGHAVSFFYLIGDQVILRPDVITPEERVHAIISDGTTITAPLAKRSLEALYHTTALRCRHHDNGGKEKRALREIHLQFLAPTSADHEGFFRRVRGFESSRNVFDIILRSFFQLYGMHVLRQTRRPDCVIAEFVGRYGTTFADFSKAVCDEHRAFSNRVEKDADAESVFVQHGYRFISERAATLEKVKTYSARRLEQLVR